MGDDDQSWGVDGVQACAWHAQRRRDDGRRWLPGDVIGLACDLRGQGRGGGGQIWVSVNGSFAAPFGAAFDLPAGVLSLFPALSARGGRVRYNFGAEWAHAPPGAGYGVFEAVEE